MDKQINNLTLQKLILHNFKAHRDYTIEPKGKPLTIFGDNGTGKSTEFDALMWLLTGKDSRGNATNYFGIKTRNENENVIHDVDHSVTGVFGDITLKRVYKEIRDNKNGRLKGRVKGHTTDYYVDDKPCKKTDYDNAIAEIMSADMLNILTDPIYFAETLADKNRRKVLMQLAGDINQEDVIAEMMSYWSMNPYWTEKPERTVKLFSNSSARN